MALSVNGNLHNDIKQLIQNICKGKENPWF